MRVLELQPVRVEPVGRYAVTGLIDVVYETRCGFLWRNRKQVTRRAMSTTGILWTWVNSPETDLYSLTLMINGHIPELSAGQTVRIN